ncbi:hypothetical protein AB0K60_02680 [Thermopolyspora sp. NPDC052614]|uniref:aggregation-promoting factor C-terminal-like domain-containing protein n=1 Tax=Thermopolyspora sp. NPDC052614 TaxID=3155682 RepID=UPI0034262E13
MTRSRAPAFRTRPEERINMDSKRTLRRTVVTVATTALLTGGAAIAAHADGKPPLGPQAAGSESPRDSEPAGHPESRPGAKGGSEHSAEASSDPSAEPGADPNSDRRPESGPRPGLNTTGTDIGADFTPDRLTETETLPALTPKRDPGHTLQPAHVHEGVWTTRAKPRNAALQRARRMLRASAQRGGNIAVKTFAFHMVTRRSWSRAQFQCLDHLWTRESNWNHRATNRSSGAYGIPQALPASKMSVSGHDWRVNPKTQIKWGLRYIRSRYGTPCAAWAHFRARGWY